jgi:hypothetical protein
MDTSNHATDGASDWEPVGRHLDAAMADLPETDRAAILLRFFRQLDFRAVGLELGVNDDTAQKRVTRALSKLRDLLCSRGVALSVVALGPVIAGNAVTAAPAGLAGTIIGGIQTGTTAAVTGGSWLWEWSQMWQARAAGLAGALAVGLLFVGWGNFGTPPAVFDLAADFPPAPGAQSPWSLGWASTLGGPLTALNYVKSFPSDNGEPLTAWQVGDIARPTFVKHMGNSTAVSAGGAYVAPPGSIFLAPEVGDTERKFCVARFTTPPGRTASYRIEVAVQPNFLGATAGDTDFHILKNGEELFGRFLGRDSGAAFSNVVHLKAGDTIDFFVGQGLDRYDEGSALRMVATLATKSSSRRQESNGRMTAAPVIVSPPSDQGVPANNNATFDVIAAGTAPLHYQWWFGVAPVAGATNATLPLPSAQPAQAGTYHVVVTNMAGSVTSAPARLTLVTCAPPPPGLVAWWRGEQNAVDPVGGQFGTLMPGVTIAPGFVGQAFRFAGPEAGFTLPASAQLDLGAAGAFTIEMWIKPDNIMGKIPLVGWNNTNAYGANLSIVNGRLYASLRDSEGTPHMAVSGGPNLMTESWKHVALTFDGPNQALRLYFDGYVMADVPIDSFRPNTTLALQIGRRMEGGTLHTYAGLMDEISLYRRALTVEEIAAIAQARRAGKCAEQITASATRDPAPSAPAADR